MHAHLSAPCPAPVPLLVTASDPGRFREPPQQAERQSTMTLCVLCYRRAGTESRLDDHPLGRLCGMCRRDLVRFIRLMIDSAVPLRSIEIRALLRILNALLLVGRRI